MNKKNVKTYHRQPEKSNTFESYKKNNKNKILIDDNSDDDKDKYFKTQNYFFNKDTKIDFKKSNINLSLLTCIFTSQSN